jgi:hypothetical protein
MANYVTVLKAKLERISKCRSHQFGLVGRRCSAAAAAAAARPCHLSGRRFFKLL